MELLSVFGMNPVEHVELTAELACGFVSKSHRDLCATMRRSARRSAWKSPIWRKQSPALRR
jgi:hypothetical protein